MTKLKTLPQAAILSTYTAQECPAAVTRLAIAGWEARQQISALEEHLKRINAMLIKEIGSDVSVLVDGVVQVSVAERQTLAVIDPPGLMRALGDRYEDLVAETISYKLSDKLKELLADGDDRQARKAREFIKVSSATTVTYRAGKPLATVQAA